SAASDVYKRQGTDTDTDTDGAGASGSGGGCRSGAPSDASWLWLLAFVGGVRRRRDGREHVRL
ncbi:MAG: hypothetical protein KUG77_22585, partial [Nannocystaceae bacterium]|nr:hypothetical protein [Nannocystaceae bacterium]